jgi:hypothetical protein
MARKPLAEKTVAENVLKYGTGGINIDESRVGTEEMKHKQVKNDKELIKVKNGGTANGITEEQRSLPCQPNPRQQ